MKTTFTVIVTLLNVFFITTNDVIRQLIERVQDEKLMEDEGFAEDFHFSLNTFIKTIEVISTDMDNAHKHTYTMNQKFEENKINPDAMAMAYLTHLYDQKQGNDPKKRLLYTAFGHFRVPEFIYQILEFSPCKWDCAVGCEVCRKPYHIFPGCRKFGYGACAYQSCPYWFDNTFQFCNCSLGLSCQRSSFCFTDYLRTFSYRWGWCGVTSGHPDINICYDRWANGMTLLKEDAYCW